MTFNIHIAIHVVYYMHIKLLGGGGGRHLMI